MSNWLERDLKYLWHPYTQMKDCEQAPPILIERAKGIKLFDQEGNYYLDTISSWWCNVHGHNHPKINAAIKAQLEDFEHVMFAGFTHKPAIRLAEQLVALAPQNLKRVFYSDNGSTAVEIALKMSYQYWHNRGVTSKKSFISLEHAYHGDTIGTMSVSGVGLFNEIFSPLFFPGYKIPSPYCYRCPMHSEQTTCGLACLLPLEELLISKGDEVAALIIEPLVQAAGGMIIYPAAYLKRVRELTSQYGIHLILDEVATGFGRTGEMFAAFHAGIEPDLLCLSKGITAGYLPLGATLTSEDIFKAFYADVQEKKTFYHGHTYTANPLACAAGLASLEIFKEENTLNNVATLSPLLKEGLARLSELPCVGDIRQIGLIGALELVKDKTSKEPFEFRQKIGAQIYQMGLAKNLILRPLGNVIYLFLPLCTTQIELEEILTATTAILKQIAC